MTKVSRIPLKKETWDKVFALFIDTLTNITDRGKLSNFVNDFFSPSERIMLSKRLAAAVLLAKGHSYESVRGKLRLSPPTIAKISRKVKYEGKGLNLVLEEIFKKQAKAIFTEEIKDVFDLPVKGDLLGPVIRNRKRQQKIKSIKEEF